VKAPFRRLGIASLLLEPMQPNRCRFTHWTHKRAQDAMGDTDDLLRKWPGAVYNPYLL
jgi:hypothetical protein